MFNISFTAHKVNFLRQVCTLKISLAFLLLPLHSVGSRNKALISEAKRGEIGGRKTVGSLQKQLQLCPFPRLPLHPWSSLLTPQLHTSNSLLTFHKLRGLGHICVRVKWGKRNKEKLRVRRLSK